jgi:class 3 adenylate cyclase
MPTATEGAQGARPALPPQPQEAPLPPALALPTAERRHLTVLCCDLVGSTALAGRLDPEEYCEVIHTYHQTCAAVVRRFDGTIAQYQGDRVLVYFGYPAAHEDDAQRAVWAELALLEALETLPSPAPLLGEPLAMRLGVHTGLVVVSEVGAGGRQELLALGEAPTIATRLQQLAAPNTLVLSAAT